MIAGVYKSEPISSGVKYRLAGWILLISSISLWPFRASGEPVRVLHGIEYQMAGRFFQVTVSCYPSVPEYRYSTYPENSFRRMVFDFPGIWKINGGYNYDVAHEWVLGIRVWAHPNFLRVVVDLPNIEVSPPEFEATDKGVVLTIRKAGETGERLRPRRSDQVHMQPAKKAGHPDLKRETGAHLRPSDQDLKEPAKKPEAPVLESVPEQPKLAEKDILENAHPLPAEDREEKARAFFDFGVFAFEEGDFESAEKYFTFALELTPSNPYGHHYMAKIRMEKERYPEALEHLENAWKTNPDIPGLKYDLATTYYKMRQYETAANLFLGLADENPDDVLANYYAGICLFHLERCDMAKKYFLLAAQKNSNIRADCNYIAGICSYKEGSFEKALEMFASVVADPDAGKLKDKARTWSDSVKKVQKTQKPWRLFVKTGVRYDDNARLEPSDRDTDEDVADYSTMASASARYIFLHQNPFNFGVDINYNQTWYDKNDDYEITASTIRLFTRYTVPPYTFRLAYKPSFVWLDSERYSEEHRLDSEIWRRITENLNAGLSYEFAKIENFRDDGKTGHSNSVFLDADYAVLNLTGKLSAGFGMVWLDTSDPEESFQQIIAKLGAWFRLPLNVDFELTGEFNDRKYDKEESGLCVARDDDRYLLKVAFSRPFIEE